VPTNRRLSLGFARTFQNIRLFANLTVWENLWMAENAPSHRAEAGFLKRWIGGRSDARASRMRWNSQAWRIVPTISPAVWPSASSAAWNWRGRWRPSPSCFKNIASKIRARHRPTRDKRNLKLSDVLLDLAGC
jgi:hypothetical protein